MFAPDNKTNTMNRTIKFRGKRLDNGEWVYGCLADYFRESGKCIMPDSYYVTKHFGEQDNLGNPILEDEMALGGFILVDPQTVGQFTGLLDKNGKEIYEGDVLLIPDYTHGAYFGKQQPTKRIVVQFQKTFNGIGYYGLPKSDEIEVIGNIHENPELLEEQQ